MQHCVKRKEPRFPHASPSLRGLAPVVGVVLIILIGVLAITALGVYVFKLKDAPQLSPTVNCLDAQTLHPFLITNACYNETTKNVQIDLYRASTDFAYASLLFTLEGEKSSSWLCGEGCGLCSLGAQDSTKRYYSPALDSVPSALQVHANGCELESKDVGVC